jgi:outer membrane protein OmpA-like peptidoglycan-associated protein
VTVRVALELSLALVTGFSPAAAAQPGAGVEGDVRDIVQEVRDIVRRIESISGDMTTTETKDAVEVTLAADVLFAFDSAKLTPEASKRISEVAAKITEDASGKVSVTGHTDSVGTDAYNQTLSEQRAASVAAALKAIAPGEYAVVGKGESEPVAENQVNGKDNPAGRKLNRRVTIAFSTEG